MNDSPVQNIDQHSHIINDSVVQNIDQHQCIMYDSSRQKLRPNPTYKLIGDIGKVIIFCFHFLN